MTNKQELNEELFRAAINGNLDEVKILLEKGADVNAKDKDGYTVLIMASDKGYEEIVKILLEKGADVNAKNKDGTTALMMASRLGNKGVVKILLEKNKSLEIHINKKPLSVNKAWQGERFKTKDYKSYECELLYTIPAQRLPKAPYSISFEFGFSNINADWDNPIKPLQDILQKKFDFNDRDIYEAYVKKVKVKKGEEYSRVKIRTLTE